MWIAHILFYIPAQIVLLYTLQRLRKQLSELTAISRTGIVLSASGVIVLLLTSIMYIFVQIRPNSKEFWYFSVISSPNISVLQIISGVLLFFGLHSLTQSYLKQQKF